MAEDRESKRPKLQLRLPDTIGFSREQYEAQERRLAADGYYDGLPLDAQPSCMHPDMGALAEAIQAYDPTGAKAHRIAQNIRDGKYDYDPSTNQSPFTIEPKDYLVFESSNGRQFVYIAGEVRKREKDTLSVMLTTSMRGFRAFVVHGWTRIYPDGSCVEHRGRGELEYTLNYRLVNVLSGEPHETEAP